MSKTIDTYLREFVEEMQMKGHEVGRTERAIFMTGAAAGIACLQGQAGPTSDARMGEAIKGILDDLRDFYAECKP